MIRNTIALIACGCLLAVSTASAQVPRPGIRGAIIDGAGMTFSSSGGGLSIQSTTRDGVRTIKANDNGKKTEIVIDAEGFITVKHTRQYGPDDMEQLEKTHPDLIMHLQAIPKESGNHKVEVSLNITTDYDAENEADLKERHPEIFELYEKYTKSGSIGGTLSIEMPRLILPPRMIEPPDADFEEMREEMKKKIEDLRQKAVDRMKADPDVIKIERIEEKDSDTEKSSDDETKKESKSDDGKKRKINENDT